MTLPKHLSALILGILVIPFFIQAPQAHATQATDQLCTVLRTLLASLPNASASLTTAVDNLCPPQGGRDTGTPTIACTNAKLLTKDLYKGVADDTQVQYLQIFLNNAGTLIDEPSSVQNPGSLNFETTHFGTLTELAVQRWQAEHEVISSGAGYGKVGPNTRTKMVAVACDGNEQQEVTTRACTTTEEGDYGPSCRICIASGQLASSVAGQACTAPVLTFQYDQSTKKLYWGVLREATGATCTARGAWSGTKPLMGDSDTTTINPGTYTLTCTGTGAKTLVVPRGEGTGVIIGTGNTSACTGLPSGATAWNQTVPTVNTPYEYSATAGVCKFKCDASHVWDEGTNSCTLGISSEAAGKIQVAAGEYVRPGAIPRNQYNLGFWGYTKVGCSLISGPLPFGLSIVSLVDVTTTGHTGCALVGVAQGTGTYNITWRGEGIDSEGKFASSTSDLEIAVYQPEATLGFSSVCAGNCKICPDATVGEEFSCTLRVDTSGDWRGRKISFNEKWGLGGNPGGLTISYMNPIAPFQLTYPEPTEADKTAFLRGIPQKAGTYQFTYCAGNGTEQHTAFCQDIGSTGYSPFVVKPAPAKSGIPSSPSLTIIKTPLYFSMAAGPTSGSSITGKTMENFSLDWGESDNNPTEYRMVITGAFDSLAVGNLLSQENRTSFTGKLETFSLGAGTYNFAIRACNATGCSGDSNQVTYIATEL